MRKLSANMLFFLFVACGIETEKGPTISAIEPGSVCLDLKQEDPSTGQRFVIRGKGFGTDGGTIDGTLATVEVWRDDFIRAQINMFGTAEKQKITVTPSGGVESENSKSLTVRNGCGNEEPGDESYLQDLDDPILTSVSASTVCRNQRNDDNSFGETFSLSGSQFGSSEGEILGLTGETIEQWTDTKVIVKVNIFENLGKHEIEVQNGDGLRSYTGQSLNIVDCD